MNNIGRVRQPQRLGSNKKKLTKEERKQLKIQNKNRMKQQKSNNRKSGANTSARR